MQNKPHKVVILALFVIVLAGYAFMAVKFPLAYIWATYEDLLGEWAQTYFFLAAAILSVLVALRDRRYRWFFALLAVACSYVVLEEISWGQRIFGYSTPDFLKSRNLQGEANLHNLFTGPHNTLLKDLISLAVSLALIGYGLIYPLLRTFKWKIALWADRIGIAAPPLVLWPFFTVAAYFELKPLSFNEAEIAELLIAMALAFTASLYHLLMRCDLSSEDSPAFGKRVLILSTTVFVLAGITTAGFYSVPEKQSRIDGRIERGMEKFARRYERYDRCDIANKLYTILLLKEPDRTYLMRKMAACYRELGRMPEFEKSVARAIETDLKIYAKDPWRASVNQSLVRSYKLAGNDEKAQAHLTEAMQIGRDRIADYPGSPKAAYSFARTLKLAGQREEALQYFTRAYEMDRTSSKYRKAYYSALASANR